MQTYFVRLNTPFGYLRYAFNSSSNESAEMTAIGKALVDYPLTKKCDIFVTDIIDIHPESLHVVGLP